MEHISKYIYVLNKTLIKGIILHKRLTLTFYDNMDNILKFFGIFGLEVMHPV